MTTYLVVKPMKEDRRYMPGETVVDPDFNADLLRERGYLTIVPDDYSGTRSATPRPPTEAEALAAGYSEEAAKALADGTYEKDPEAKKKVDEETDEIDAQLSNDPEGPLTEAQLAKIVEGMTDGDLRNAVQVYELEVPDAETATREDKEKALVAYLLEHPELTDEDSDDTIAPSDSDIAESGASADDDDDDEDAGDVGAAPDSASEVAESKAKKRTRSKS